MSFASRRSLALLVLAAIAGMVLAGGPSAIAQTPTPSPSASSSVSPSPTPSSTASPSSTPTPTPTPSPSPSQSNQPPPSDIQIQSRSSDLVAPVGELVTYTVEVQATGDPKVLVTVEVPPEIDVESVPLNDNVSDMAATKHGIAEGIVWNVDTSGGTPVELHWVGRVVASGDLEATSVIRAETKHAAAAATQQTFLASTATPDVEGVAPPKVKGKVVKMVPVRVPAETVGPGAVLPMTGWSPVGPLWSAFVLFLLGSLLLVLSRNRMRVRDIVALSLLIAVSVACTTATEPQAKDATTESAPQVTDEATESTETKVPDQVLGKRIHANADDLAASEDVAEDATSAFEIVYERVLVEVPGEPVADQPTRVGDNTVSFLWDEDRRIVETATSGIMFTADQPSALTTGLDWNENGLNSVVTLENSSGEPLRVKGTVQLQVSSGSASSTLNSDPIDVILAPGGSVAVSFHYLLPSGDSNVTSLFVV